MKNKWFSLLLCTILMLSMLVALPMKTAHAADVTLEVTHSKSGNLAAEIITALGSNTASDYTKIKVNIGSTDLSGNCNSGDWKALYTLNNTTLPKVRALELDYTSENHTIPIEALNNCTWIYSLALTTSGGQLTAINMSAFDSDINLQELSLPQNGGLTSIEYSAFNSCYSLTGTLTIPPSVQTIRNSAFNNCSKLSGTLTIPSSVQTIGDYAFCNCFKLDALSLPQDGSLSSIGNNAFSDCYRLSGTLTIPSSVQTIGDYAFCNCFNLDALSLPQSGSLTGIGEYTFYRCEELSGTLAIPASVQTIGKSAFESCSKLDTLSLPQGGSLAEIGTTAFNNCSGLLGTVTIPASVNSIDSDAFSGCLNLAALVFKNTSGAPTMSGYITDQTQIRAYYPAAAQTFYTAQSFMPPPTNLMACGNTSALITSFCIGGVSGVIDQTAKTATLELSKETSLSSIQPLVSIIGDSVSPASGAAQDFSSRKLIYTVTPASGTPANYTVRIVGYPTVTGSNALSGTMGKVGSQIAAATVSGSFPEKLVLSAKINGQEDLSAPTGNGKTSFGFDSSMLDDLSVGVYPITVTMDATSCNKAIPSTQIGTLTVKPLAPVMKTATAAEGSVTVSWDAVSGVDGYKVYSYNPISKSYTEIANTTDTSYTHTGRTAGTTYTYAVRAYQTVDSTPIYSNYSEIASAKTTLPVVGVPSGLKAAAASNSSIRLTWDAVSGVDGYKVYSYNPISKSYTEIANTTDTSYTHTGRTAGTTYTYAVRAYQTVDSTPIYSDYSATASAKTPLPSIGVPSGLKAVSASYNSIQLTWNAAAGAANYVVYRAFAAAGPYTQLTTSATSAGYTDAKLTTGTTYYYKIKAYATVNGMQMYGNETVVVSTKPVLASPGAVKAIKASATSIKVSWGAVSGATKYQVCRATAAVGKYTLATTTASKSFTNKGLKKGTTYYFRIMAYRLVGKTKISGSYSIIIKMKL